MLITKNTYLCSVIFSLNLYIFLCLKYLLMFKMLVCSVQSCDYRFPNVDDLTAHLLFYHHRLCSDNFECRQPGCLRTFSQLYSLKRHLLRDHVNHVGDGELHLAGNNANNALPEEPQVLNDQIGPVVGNDDINPNNVRDEAEALNARLTLENFVNVLCTNIQLYVAQLYAIPNMSRKLVDTIISGTSELFCSSIRLLKENVFNVISDGDFHNENFADDVRKLENMFEVLGDPFEAMATEHQRLRSLSEDGFFIRPEPYEMGHIDKHVTVNNTVQLIRSPVYGQFIPLRRVLKAFLELPGTFKAITDYMLKLNNDDSGKVSNFVQGDLWKQISASYRNEGKFVLPLNAEFDDYEPDNALGSHQGEHSLGGLYARLMCLPPQFQSSLDNMFLLSIFEV